MRYDPRNRLGRIRVRWVTALTGLALVPLIIVVGAVPYQLFVEARLTRAATSAVERVAEGANPASVAQRSHVRVRVVSPQGATAHGQAAMSRWTNHIALRFVERESRVLAEQYDARAATLGPQEVGRGCAVVGSGRLLSCHAAVRLDDGRLITAEAASIKTVSTLYGQRAPLMAVMLQVLGFAFALGIWGGRRTVGPIDRLRACVLERTAAPVSTEPVPVERPDEVGELAVAFNELLAALQAQRQANLDFVSEVAHELKTPIATIQQFADLAHAVADPRLERPLGALEQSCARLHMRTNELLELARANAGLPGQDRELVAVDELVRGVAQSHHACDRIEVSSSSRCEVTASLRYLEIAVRNVIDNAARHGTDVRIDVRRTNDDVVVTVRDDGPGIPEDEHEAIFDRFHSRSDGGTGLGLAMTRAIARAHGGDATAQLADIGACVELRLAAAVTPQS